MRTSKPTYVAVVAISRHYGGSEEGGWWYDWSDIEEVHRFDNPKRARRIARRLQREIVNPRHNRFSVLGGTDREVRRTRDPQHLDWWQSKRRPRYE